MFGYVTPLIPELKVKEHDFYKSLYCGLCRSMGLNVCSASRLTLSYDFVFLSLILSALQNESFEFEERRCPAHPLKKRPMVKSTPTLIYSARAGAIMASSKLLDDIRDSKQPKRLLYSLLLPSAKRMRKKAALSDLSDRIDRGLDELHRLEEENCSSPDRMAQIFGEILSDVFSSFFGDSEDDLLKKRIAAECGLHAGRWIYLLDAADDYVSDRKSGSYNPFLCAERENGAETPETLSENVREPLANSLIMELIGIERAFALIDWNDTGIKNISENIIYLGMPAKQKEILDRCGDASRHSSIRRKSGRTES